MVFQPVELLECTECHSSSSYADEMPQPAREPRASSCGGSGLRAGLGRRLDIRGHVGVPWHSITTDTSSAAAPKLGLTPTSPRCTDYNSLCLTILGQFRPMGARNRRMGESQKTGN